MNIESGCTLDNNDYKYKITSEPCKIIIVESKLSVMLRSKFFKGFFNLCVAVFVLYRFR